MNEQGTNKHVTDLSTDNCLPFFRDRQTLEWIVEDFTKSLFFLLCLIQRLRLGYLRVLPFMVYLTFHGFVLLFIVDFIYVAIISQIQRIAINTVCQTGNSLKYFQYGIIIILQLVVNPFYLETSMKMALY